MFHETLTAPAKINLSLRVLRRREDGYHEIDSIFVPISLADRVELRFEAAATTSIVCECPERPELGGAGNLAARAAQAYLARVGATGQVQLRIDKRIWVAAGLGGGSSDAAAVLRGLNRYFVGQGRGLAVEELASVALTLGADVPYFLEPTVARVRGIGELLTPLEGIGRLSLVLANPRIPLATADVYRGLGLAPGQVSTPLDAVALPPLDGTLAPLIPIVINDLEPPARRLCPPIVELERQLRSRGAVVASMSGSGPTVFGLFESDADARAAAEEMRLFTDGYVVSASGGSGLTLDSGSPI